MRNVDTAISATPLTAAAILEAYRHMRRCLRRAARAQLRAEQAAAVIYGSPEGARLYVRCALPAALLVERHRRKDGPR